MDNYPEIKNQETQEQLDLAYDRMEAAQNSDEIVVALEGLERSVGLRQFIPFSESRKVVRHGRELATSNIHEQFMDRHATDPSRTESNKRDLRNYREIVGHYSLMASGVYFGDSFMPYARGEKYKEMRSAYKAAKGPSRASKAAGWLKGKFQGTTEADWKARTDRGLAEFDAQVRAHADDGDKQADKVIAITAVDRGMRRQKNGVTSPMVDNEGYTADARNDEYLAYLKRRYGDKRGTPHRYSPVTPSNPTPISRHNFTSEEYRKQGLTGEAKKEAEEALKLKSSAKSQYDPAPPTPDHWRNNKPRNQGGQRRNTP